MAQFKFQLEGVLVQRKNIEQIAQREVALATKAMTDLQDKLKRLDENVKQVSDDVRQNHLTGTLDVGFITAHRRYVINMERLAVDLARQIAEAQAKVKKAHETMIEAARQRKTIEKLREKQFERWRLEEDRRENTLLDEAGMQIAYGNLVQERQAANN
jgi:flagellar FliJ protein